jgi:glycerol-3-phosphate acyltransferase PlsY
MEPVIVLVSAVAGYLLGSISFARIITARYAPGAVLDDLQVEVRGTNETTPVGIVGANAASMVLGPRLGLAVALLDMLKVIVPMVVLWLLFPDQPYALVAAGAGLVGHNWPVYYRFRGGRGFAVIFASYLLIDFAGALVSTIAGLLVGFGLFGNPMVGYMLWLPFMIVWLIIRGTTAELVYALFAGLVFLLAVIPEIRNMLAMRRAGKYQAYMAGLYDSSPRWRGMKKMADRMWLFKKR